jgi:hypothetical protein
MKPAIRDFVHDEFGGVPLNALGLMASVFGISLLGMGRYIEEARAQTALQTEISLTLPLQSLRMDAQAQVQVRSAMHLMNDSELSLTYARIHATFREYLGQDDLTVARALVDYAMLAEAEMHQRGLRRPGGTESARDMLTTYELVL